jgi:hypothetical protein
MDLLRMLLLILMLLLLLVLLVRVRPLTLSTLVVHGRLAVMLWWRRVIRRVYIRIAWRLMMVRVAGPGRMGLARHMRTWCPLPVDVRTVARSSVGRVGVRMEVVAGMVVAKPTYVER